MSKFGWSYPPGAANDPNAPYNQNDDGPCEVCGQSYDDCICPECTTCGQIGDPACYDGGYTCSWCGIRPGGFDIASCINKPYGHCDPKAFESHGQKRSQWQIVLREAAEADWLAQAKAEADWEAQLDDLDTYIESLEEQIEKGTRRLSPHHVPHDGPHDASCFADFDN